MSFNRNYSARCFYRVIFPGSSISGLEIPPEFLDHMKEEPSGVATLESVSSRRKWHVKLSKESDVIVFKDGFERFYIDNSLNFNDVLLFRYHGNLKFKVQIFDQSGSRKDIIRE
ncbi:hypothetical protein ACJIZ3_019118 [Penstemon smallii]|uniref:TF-B3 domain-containing protein n=1 Tax=Penstemon smallii TaxID=265156 RepID=A0ABD3T093_9LAMI